MNTKRCVSWVAVSSEKQAERISPEKQRADNLHFVDEVLPVTYRVRGELVEDLSLADTRSIVELREASLLYPESYGRLEALIKSEPKAFDILVCRSADRLGRSRTLISTIEELCEQRGIVIVYVREQLPSSLDPISMEGSAYIAAIKGAQAREEIKRLVARHADGMLERVRKAKSFPGRIPYGYAIADGKIIIVPAAAETIRRIIVDLYLGLGMGVYRIADILNEEDRLSPTGKQWVPTSVKGILFRAARYAGWIEYNKVPRDKTKPKKEYIRIKGNYPQIITDEEFERFQAERKARFKRPVRKKLLLSGVCYCISCGRPLTYQGFGRIRKDKTVNYTSTLCCKRRTCTSRVAVREHAVITALTEFLETLSNTAQIDTYIQINTSKPKDYSWQIGIVESSLEQVEAGRKRVIHAYVNLQLIEEEEFTSQIRRLNTKTEQLKNELNSLADQQRNAKNNQERQTRFRQIQQEVEHFFLDMKDENIITCNRWLQDNIKIWIQPGKRSDPRIHKIEVLV